MLGNHKRGYHAVFHKFYHLGGANAESINTGMIALLPKKDGALEIGNFRPISLLHSIRKLIAKVLSIRLSG